MRSKQNNLSLFTIFAVLLFFNAQAQSSDSCNFDIGDNFTQRFYRTYKESLNSQSEQLAYVPSISGVPPIEENDNNSSPFMNALYCGKNGQKIKDSRIKFYGWFDVGGNLSSSKSRYDVNSGIGGNSPSGYYNHANQIILNQAVFNLESIPDGQQKQKITYGFRIASLYGTDYQYTVASKLMSNQLLKNNKKYGFDPHLFYGDIYVPYFIEGLNIRIGRYSTLHDIESTFSNGNYLYSHSMLNVYDPYTHQGTVATLKLNKNFKTQLEIYNGSDTAINDTKNNRASFGVCVHYNSNDNNDKVYPCVTGLNGGKYSYNNLQMHSINWYHKFNNKWSMANQVYYAWQDGVPNSNNLNSKEVIPGTKPAKCNSSNYLCKSSSIAAVNYLVYQFSSKDFFTLRNDLFRDNHGQRTGYNTTYSSHTIGLTHWIGNVISFRPELRLDHSYNKRVYNGEKKLNQYIVAADMIINF